MTSKRLEALGALISDSERASRRVGWTEGNERLTACDMEDAARSALVKWVDEYGAAQRREGRRDAKGRVSSRVERGEK